MTQEEPPRPTAGSSNEARHEAAQVLRRFLAAVTTGELEAGSAQAKALVRRIEGAVVGLEADHGDLDEAAP